MSTETLEIEHAGVLVDATLEFADDGTHTIISLIAPGHLDLAPIFAHHDMLDQVAIDIAPAVERALEQRATDEEEGRGLDREESLNDLFNQASDLSHAQVHP